MKVLVTGDSHCGALYRGMKELAHSGTPLTNVTIRPLGGGCYFNRTFFKDAGAYAHITNPQFRKQFVRFPPADYDVVGISGPLHSTRVWRRDWKSYCPWGIECNGQESAISHSLVRALIEDDTRYLLSFIEIIKRTRPVFVIEAPAPFRHHRAVERNGFKKVSFLNRAYRSLVAKKLEESRIPVVTLDPDWLDEDGFMTSRLRSENLSDMDHGNTEFGRIMMERVHKLLSDYDFGLQAAA